MTARIAPWKGVLRDYRSDDLSKLVELDRLCFDNRFRFSHSVMRPLVQAKKASTRVAESRGNLLGFCITHIGRTEGVPTAYLTTLDVHPSHRRLGIAHSLLDDVAAQARVQGCGAIHLHVFTNNGAAVAFYEREAFVRGDIVPDFYGPDLHAYSYQKLLMS